MSETVEQVAAETRSWIDFAGPLAQVTALQWAGLAGLLAGAVATAWVVTWIGVAIGRRTAKKLEAPVVATALRRTRWPAASLIALGIFGLGALAFELPREIDRTMVKVVSVLAVAGATWLLLRVVDVWGDYFRDHLVESGQKAAVSVVSVGTRVVNGALVVIAFLMILQNLGVNVSGIFAGLGLGGIAVALAARKSVENLFGGMMLVIDQPIRVGDYCKFGDREGTVEEIGLRSTKIRTMERTLITVPNFEFSEVQIENLAFRDRFRLLMTLGLRYETGPEQMRYLLAELRRLLHAHPSVLEDPVRVRFVGFGDYSLDVEVHTYVAAPDWSGFMAVREDIMLRMMELVEASGSGFAFPSQTAYLGRDTGVDEAQAATAAATVEGWRREGRLPFPDPDPETVAEIDDTLDYPPRGSVSAGDERDG